jgi:RNA polymerase sigma-70 factor (ECF subfamily)
MTSILKHKILDYIRKKYREPRFEPDHIDLQTQPDAFDDFGKWKTGPQAWASDPVKLLEQKSFLSVVTSCLKDLPQKQGQALALRELQGETTDVICKVLNISATNCWVLLHRARALMRKCIEINWMDNREVE